jgi:muramoyltetrapeptide carboxypeptidase
MISPPFLKPGDKIAIVAPARKISAAEVDLAIKSFQQWGLKVVNGQHLFGEENQFSGSDEERTSDFQAMLDDIEIKAIVCARGGYGTVRIIDKLNFNVFEQHPKWVVGYSDITVLHSHIQTQFGIETIHAVMPINFPDKGADHSIESLRKALFGEVLEYKNTSNVLNVCGNTTGTLCGGNLSIIYALNGTPSDLQTDDKILFIEDVDEYLYHLDRMMINLKRNGKLDKIKGLIVGGLTKMNDNAVGFGKQAEEIIAKYVSDKGIPVCFDFPAGHGARNSALILGREVSLNVDNKGVSLLFLSVGETATSGSTFRRMLKPTLFFLAFFVFIYAVLALIKVFVK